MKTVKAPSRGSHCWTLQEFELPGEKPSKLYVSAGADPCNSDRSSYVCETFCPTPVEFREQVQKNKHQTDRHVHSTNHRHRATGQHLDT